MVLKMKRLVKILSASAIVLLFSVAETTAQKSKLRYAESLKSELNYKTAIKVYEEAYAQKPKMSTAQAIAETYDEIRDYDNSYKWWETAVGYEEAGQEQWLGYLKAARLTGNLEDAESALSSRFPNDSLPSVSPFPEIKSKGNVKPENVEALNSSESDFGLVMDAEGNKYFVSDRGGSYVDEMPSIRIDGRNKYFSEEKQDYTGREYFSVYKEDEEGNISEVISNVPSALNFSDPSFAKEEGVLFYSVTRDIKKAKKDRDIEIFPEIYYSMVAEDGSLSGFSPVPFNDSIGYAVMHPFVDEEAKRLYFTTNMDPAWSDSTKKASREPKYKDDFDIYYAEYDENMVFSAPVRLSDQVNTAGSETHPFRKDDKFYFSSKQIDGEGHPTVGGMDIYEASYSNGTISNVQNMGIPVNSLGDDFAYRVMDNGETYLSSNRDGGQGLDDIYLIAEQYKQFVARVIDCEGAVVTDSYLATLQDKTQNLQVPTDRKGTGELTAQLEPDSDFGITISKPGYFTLTDESITTKGFEGDTVRREYTLTPIPYQLPVYVDIVYYDLDKFVIREDAKEALDKLGEMMNKYSFLDLLVGSHTDSRASDEYNITLSNNRAKAVSDYLAQYGISADRIRLEWFGESELINDCGNGVPCPEAEHQLNRRSELVLEAFPDPTKQYDIPQELLDQNFCDPEQIFEALQDEIREIPTIYFDFDKSMLRSVHKKELERTAIMLNRMPNLMLYIEGHTDQRGSDEYNQGLSERRAEVVKEYLRARGVEDGRMEDTWFGETRPVNDCSTGNCTEAMHQLNRRTELRVGKSSFSYTGRKKKVDTMEEEE